MKLLFKEIRNLYRFFFATPRTEKEIVFYAENRWYFMYLAGIVDYLTHEHGIHITYITSDADDPILKKEQTHIHCFYFNTLLPYVMAFVNTRVWVMTLTELGNGHLYRSTYPVHYVYIFHALVSTHMMYREGAFDNYDTILCVGPHQVTEIRKREQDEHLRPKNLIEAGYHPLEHMYQSYKDYKVAQQPPSKKTIFIAPSWGDNNILESIGKELVEALLKADYTVIVRPHPEALRRAVSFLSSFSESFAGQHHFSFDISSSPEQNIFRADLLISDCSGIMLEYAFATERPVLSISVPPKIKNPNYTKLKIEPIELQLRSRFGVVVSPNDIPTILQTAQTLITQKDAYRERIQKLRSEYIFNFGTSAQTSTQAIMDVLKNK
jgi:hypothetical protein